MQAGLQMAGSFALCIGRSPFSEMEPRSGGIELKARQNGRGGTQCANYLLRKQKICVRVNSS